MSLDYKAQTALTFNLFGFSMANRKKKKLKNHIHKKKTQLSFTTKTFFLSFGQTLRGRKVKGKFSQHLVHTEIAKKKRFTE